jgi:hypothetical protein
MFWKYAELAQIMSYCELLLVMLRYRGFIARELVK